MENIQVAAVGVELAVVLAGDFMDDTALFQSREGLDRGRSGNAKRTGCLRDAGDRAALEVLMQADDRCCLGLERNGIPPEKLE